MRRFVSWLTRGFLAVLSGILWVLSLPKVRDAIWGKVVGKSQEKVIDARAHVVEGTKTGGKKKKKKGLFG